MQKSLNEFIHKKSKNSRRVFIKEGIVKRGKVVVEGLEVFFPDEKFIKLGKGGKGEKLCVGIVGDYDAKSGGLVIDAIFIGSEENVKKYLSTFGGADLIIFKEVK